MAEKSAKVTRVKPKWEKPGKLDPTKGKAAELQAELEQLQSKYGDELFAIEYQSGQDGLNQTLARDNQFPVPLFQRDPYDNVVALKQAMPDSMGKKTLMVEDLEWARRKQEQVTAANFEVWKANLFNRGLGLGIGFLFAN
jgi:hypothetical protein